MLMYISTMVRGGKVVYNDTWHRKIGPAWGGRMAMAASVNGNGGPRVGRAAVSTGTSDGMRQRFLKFKEERLWICLVYW